MKIIELEQNSEAWEAIRRGVLTASKAGEWLIAEPKLALTGPDMKAILKQQGIPFKSTAKVGELAALTPNEFKTYAIPKDAQRAKRQVMCDLIGEVLDPAYCDGFTGNRFTDWGHDLEPQSALAFKMETGLDLRKAGFCMHESEWDLPIFNDHKSSLFGFSPDMLIFKAGELSGIFETKNLSPGKHVSDLVNGVVPPDKEMQLHFGLAISGLPEAHYYEHSDSDRMKCMHIVVEPDEKTERVKDGIARFAAEFEEFQAEHIGKIKA